MKPYEGHTTQPTSKYGLQVQSPHYEGDGIRYETETRSIKSLFRLSSRESKYILPNHFGLILLCSTLIQTY